MTRIGVFLCTCDQKINKSIDVDVVESEFREKPVFSDPTPLHYGGTGKTGFWTVTRMAHACLPDGIAALEQIIRENNLDRVVVAACPARFQEKHLCDACVKANVNVNHFALVDWREGCAWAHRGDKEGATAKAIDLVQMGIARVENAHALDGVLTKITPRVLVIGGGIAGMTAARTLADRGIAVTLVEQEAHLGGQLRGIPLDGMAPAYDETMLAVTQHPNIEVHLDSRVVAVNGSVGNYCVEMVSAASSNTFEIAAGAIVVATGAQEYREARLYRHDGRRVVTLSEFEIQNSKFKIQNSDLQPPISNLQPPTSLVYILCAGSRDAHIPYCSNVCCLGALHQAIRVKRANSDTRVTVLFRDLYLLGDEMNEEVVREARRAGIEFVRYAASRPPRVDDETVVVRDELTGATRRIEYDRVVLATALVPRPDAGRIARLLNLARDEDGFFPDAHLRLRPEDQIERGIFVCGSAHRPADGDTAMFQGLTAAARAARFIQEREVMRPAWSAMVNPQLCTGCAQCVETCAFGAITLTPTPLPMGEGQRGEGEGRLDRAVIDPFVCLACGNCVAACPTKAIEMPNPSDAQIFAQIEAVLSRQVDKYTGTQGDKETRKQGDGAPVYLSASLPVYLVFACQWSGFAAMELAGARRIKYPANVRVIELPCSARLDPLHVLYAFFNGAERVMLALCPPNECHFGSGNRYAEARIENLRTQLAAHGIDPRRLQLARMMGDDAAAWVRAIEGGSLVHYTTR